MAGTRLASGARAPNRYASSLDEYAPPHPQEPSNRATPGAGLVPRPGEPHREHLPTPLAVPCM